MNINIGLIGKGNVGTSFLQLLNKKNPIIIDSREFDIRVVGIFEHDGAILNENGINLENLLELGKDFRIHKNWKFGYRALDYINKINLNILIETTPTNPENGEPAISHILKALNNDIDVISSNKAPFFLKYKKIKEKAKHRKRFIKYEATVASCVPILSIKRNLQGNEIIGISAILNGTSNYILSKMSDNGISFKQALKEAQSLGYAEADPNLDIKGYDAAGKLVILANELLGYNMTIKDVDIKGIENIDEHDIELVKSNNQVFKHLSFAKNGHLCVKPQGIDKYSYFNINGSLNVVELETKNAGKIVLLGRGAGGIEAASAIMNDLISILQERYFKD
ncbi:MAG: homoserine dehydrogenase [Promethearchaeota archaeon]